MKPRFLIRFDWIAGAVAGVIMLALRNWLIDFYQLPGELLLFIGFANLAYASVSFTLAMKSHGDHVPYLSVVAIANMTWAVLCLAFAMTWFRTASVYGLGQLIGEAIFVGGLGILEWRAANRFNSHSARTVM